MRRSATSNRSAEAGVVDVAKTPRASRSSSAQVLQRSSNHSVQIGVGFDCLSRVLAVQQQGDRLFAGSSYNGMFRSTDNGESWKEVNSGLANTSVFSLISHDSTLFAGTFGSGIFLSTDNGESWTSFSSGLNAFNVYSLAINGNELFAGTGDSCIWHRPLSETISISDRPKWISAARQNPFDLEVSGSMNSRLSIAFSLPRPAHVVVTLYNISGKTISCIFDKHAGAGSYRIQWDTGIMARGCYAIKIQAGGESLARIVRLDR